MSELFREYKFENYQVRKADSKDTKAVIQLLRDTARWLQAKGVSQWEYLLEGGETEEIEQDILAGATYIVENSEGDLAATFNLSSKQNDWDRHMWGIMDDFAYYLHRLAVAKDQHHKQVGKQLLEWIDGNIQMQNGYVRLDCVADNLVLDYYYQQAGYTFIGYVGDGEDKFSIYEKAFKGNP